MGREYRLQPDARLREESDRRKTRIPAPLPAEIARVRIARRAAIIGIDVGEDFLDLAALEQRTGRLCYARIDLRAAPLRDPIAWLASELSEKAPILGRGAIAIVDSPATPRIDPARERAIDSCLRAMVARINAEAMRANRIVLAMFPTPPRKTFADFAAAPDCKPHLRHFARAIFGGSINVRSGRSGTPAATPKRADARRQSGGQIFTRFMLSGFATHRALTSLGIDTFEGYPYLAFCLWKRWEAFLPPKRERGAVAARVRILNRMLLASWPEALPTPSTIDQVDAAVLAICAAAAREGGQNLSISHPVEGRLLVALPPSFAKLTHTQQLSRLSRRPA